MLQLLTEIKASVDATREIVERLSVNNKVKIDTHVKYIQWGIREDPSWKVQLRSVDIYSNYRAWCKEKGCHCVNNIHLGRAICGMFPAIKKKQEEILIENIWVRVTVYTGIAYTAEAFRNLTDKPLPAVVDVSEIYPDDEIPM